MVFERLLNRSVGYHTNNISGKLIADAMDFVQAFNTLALATLNNALLFVSILVVGMVVVYTITLGSSVYS